MVRVIEAKSFTQRLVGLTGRRRLDRETVFLFRNCRAIHTFFMRCPIDVILTDREGKIVQLRENMRPWRIHLGAGAGRDLYEAAGGFIREHGLKTGAVFAQTSLKGG